MRFRLAILLLLLVIITVSACRKVVKPVYEYRHGAIIRGDRQQKQLALVFTGGDYADGGEYIAGVLRERGIKAAFFFTGDFYRNSKFQSIIETLRRDGHYLGAHSDKHLLYCSWEDRDSLLVSKTEFTQDLLANYREMERFGIRRIEARFFLPPYEWYNDSIAVWTAKQGLQLVNFSPGTLSSADYTIPSMTNYRSSELIYQSILDWEAQDPDGLNGFILLLHVGTHPERTDKMYRQLPELLDSIVARGYRWVRIDDLLPMKKCQ
jgi:peptidoglycan/xylan/chitin deacetylase (PgdA/CDA1 family)